MKPRIGITLDLDQGGVRYQLERAYVEAVAAAGGLPLLLPHGRADVKAYLDQCDGIVISGGASDIPPERYGEQRRPECGPSNPERTEFECALCEAALANRLPVLGVCGGMQLMNVVRGGTLYQDLESELNLKHELSPKSAPCHELEIVSQTLLARLLGTTTLLVNSTHHQAVRQPGRGFVVSARARDGVVEAIELTDVPFALGVQWHPEAVTPSEIQYAAHAAVYRGLVAAARDRSS